jgi:hypothetical protein
MKRINLKARIKRNMLDKLSGENYRDEHSEIIQNLNNLGADILVGIEREDGVYTLIGSETIYYMTSSMIQEKCSIKDFLGILQAAAMTNGKMVTYEFVKINKNVSVWVMNAQVMNALSNTMLLLDSVDR